MGRLAFPISVAAAAVLVFAAPVAAADVGDEDGVPSRTAFSFRSVVPGVQWGTSNEYEMRTGLSLVKLYMVDYALHRGDGSATDLALAERMIRYSDDSAADALGAKYPEAIDAIAAEYGLTGTRSGPAWGSSYTSTADVATFLATKKRTEPGSPIFTWMAAAGAQAADGTSQDWGTARLPGVQGSKWGWSDSGPLEVASASFGAGFAVAAHTRGTPEDQTADVTATLPWLVLALVERVTG
ncbi:class A beta-lactamase-related serine hydrolase [Nocardia sp. NBC_00565]|uniref:hypothetical protein n=1 Tax=Nocardia sp. NBC_00565 TaxID=2975993 RepID=UPI002E80120F|nr:hypothetical protein [Nocardia sp. NBC_00565]WUC04188.1 class A beta-lactamase-related serine hydrolase [Nocardia sp. NBC_00565]